MVVLYIKKKCLAWFHIFKFHISQILSYANKPSNTSMESLCIQLSDDVYIPVSKYWPLWLFCGPGSHLCSTPKTMSFRPTCLERREEISSLNNSILRELFLTDDFYILFKSLLRYFMNTFSQKRSPQEQLLRRWSIWPLRKHNKNLYRTCARKRTLITIF